MAEQSQAVERLIGAHAETAGLTEAQTNLLTDTITSGYIMGQWAQVNEDEHRQAIAQEIAGPGNTVTAEQQEVADKMYDMIVASGMAGKDFGTTELAEIGFYNRVAQADLPDAPPAPKSPNQ